MTECITQNTAGERGIIDAGRYIFVRTLDTVAPTNHGIVPNDVESYTPPVHSSININTKFPVLQHSKHYLFPEIGSEAERKPE